MTFIDVLDYLFQLLQKDLRFCLCLGTFSCDLMAQFMSDERFLSFVQRGSFHSKIFVCLFTYNEMGQ